jgi:glycerophosphoryl diester phosphodiesterase
MTSGRTLRLAHRGDQRHGAENTLPALLAALAVPGCDGVEFDVRSAADGVPVLLHDETLKRVQGRPERVSDMPADRLATFGIPTLAEVLAAVPRSASLDVELKGAVDLPAVVEVLERGRGQDLAGAVVSAFEADTLDGLGRLRPAWPRWLNTHHPTPAAIRVAADLGCRALAADWRSVDERVVSEIRDAGLDFASWTVRRPSIYAWLVQLGAIAICVEGEALDP